MLVDVASADTNSGAARDVLSQGSVQEFQVNRNSYNAEFGARRAGIVNIVSKTGSNSFHGSVFGYFRDDRFDTRMPLTSRQTARPLSIATVRVSLGGPIIQDKTFFFTTVERLDEGRPTFVNLLNDRHFQLTPIRMACLAFWMAL